MALNSSNSGYTYLYSTYNPAYSNMYNISISCEGLQNSDTIKDIFTKNIVFLAKQVSFMSNSLSLTRDDFTKKFKLNGNSAYAWTDAVTITWGETSAWTIKRLHDAWLGLFYDKDQDCFISEDTTDPNYNRYMTLRVYLPESWNSTGSKCLVLKNCLPSKSGDVQMSWSANPSIISHSINYYPERIYWEDSTYSSEVNG